MGFFDEDPFEDFVHEFFSQPGVRRKRESVSDEEDRIMHLIESDAIIFLTVELPGFEEDDIEVSVNDRSLAIEARTKKEKGMRDYLSQKLAQGIHIRKVLPTDVNAKKARHTFRNGILEISFAKQ